MDSHSEANPSRVQIIRTTPSVGPEEVFARRRCYMGISLDNPVFHGRGLQDLVGWALDHFDQCLMIVGDMLRRYNEMMLNGLPEQQAVAAAEQHGTAFLGELAPLLDGLDTQRLTVLRWRDGLAMDEYAAARQAMDRLYAEDTAFRAAVQRDAHAFIRRRKRRNQPIRVDDEQALELSCRYLLEEIAVFDVLSQRGWTVELYPGPELEVLVDVARGRFDGVPAGLKQRINVELRVREQASAAELEG